MLRMRGWSLGSRSKSKDPLSDEGDDDSISIDPSDCSVYLSRQELQAINPNEDTNQKNKRDTDESSNVDPRDCSVYLSRQELHALTPAVDKTEGKVEFRLDHDDGGGKKRPETDSSTSEVSGCELPAKEDQTTDANNADMTNRNQKRTEDDDKTNISAVSNKSSNTTLKFWLNCLDEKENGPYVDDVISPLSEPNKTPTSTVVPEDCANSPMLNVASEAKSGTPGESTSPSTDTRRSPLDDVSPKAANSQLLSTAPLQPNGESGLQQHFSSINLVNQENTTMSDAESRFLQEIRSFSFSSKDCNTGDKNGPMTIPPKDITLPRRAIRRKKENQERVANENNAYAYTNKDCSSGQPSSASGDLETLEDRSNEETKQLSAPSDESSHESTSNVVKAKTDTTSVEGLSSVPSDEISPGSIPGSQTDEHKQESTFSLLESSRAILENCENVLTMHGSPPTANNSSERKMEPEKASPATSDGKTEPSSDSQEGALGETDTRVAHPLALSLPSFEHHNFPASDTSKRTTEPRFNILTTEDLREHKTEPSNDNSKQVEATGLHVSRPLALSIPSFEDDNFPEKLPDFSRDFCIEESVTEAETSVAHSHETSTIIAPISPCELNEDGEDPYAWAYDVWFQVGLLKKRPPRPPKKPLVYNPAPDLSQDHASPRRSVAAIISPRHQSARSDLRTETKLATTKKPRRSRKSLPANMRPHIVGQEKSFANILQQWRDKSDDQPNSHFLASDTRESGGENRIDGTSKPTDPSYRRKTIFSGVERTVTSPIQNASSPHTTSRHREIASTKTMRLPSTQKVDEVSVRPIDPVASPTTCGTPFKIPLTTTRMLKFPRKHCDDATAHQMHPVRSPSTTRINCTSKVPLTSPRRMTSTSIKSSPDKSDISSTWAKPLTSPRLVPSSKASLSSPRTGRNAIDKGSDKPQFPESKQIQAVPSPPRPMRVLDVASWDAIEEEDVPSPETQASRLTNYIKNHADSTTTSLSGLTPMKSEMKRSSVKRFQRCKSPPQSRNGFKAAIHSALEKVAGRDWGSQAQGDEGRSDEGSNEKGSLPAEAVLGPSEFYRKEASLHGRCRSRSGNDEVDKQKRSLSAPRNVERWRSPSKGQAKVTSEVKPKELHQSQVSRMESRAKSAPRNRPRPRPPRTSNQSEHQSRFHRVGKQHLTARHASREQQREAPVRIIVEEQARNLPEPDSLQGKRKVESGRNASRSRGYHNLKEKLRDQELRVKTDDNNAFGFGFAAGTEDDLSFDSSSGKHSECASNSVISRTYSGSTLSTPRGQSLAESIGSDSPWMQQVVTRLNEGIRGHQRITPKGRANAERPWQHDMLMEKVGNFEHDRTCASERGICQCEKSVFSENDDLIDFFLPLMGMACSCGRRASGLQNPQAPTALENILRPWQVEFLAAFGIHHGDQMVKAHHRSASALAIALRDYRKKHGMTPYRTKSCCMAVKIWSKTCKAFVRSIRRQLQAGNAQIRVPNTLYILSSFMETLPGQGTSPLAANTEAMGTHHKTPQNRGEQGNTSHDFCLDDIQVESQREL